MTSDFSTKGNRILGVFWEATAYFECMNKDMEKDTSFPKITLRQLPLVDCC